MMVDPALFREAVRAAVEGRKAVWFDGVLTSLYAISCETNGSREQIPADLCEILRLPKNAVYHDGGKKLRRFFMNEKL